MRRLVLLAAVLGLAAAGMPATAAPAVVSSIGPGYIATDNVEWLGNIPLNTDSAGARILDDHLYVTDDRGLTIYDISSPEDPQRVGFALVPQGAYYVEEDPDTNGEILLISGYSDLTRGRGPLLDYLQIVDVSDKSAPHVRSVLPLAEQHTWSCILECTWAYGSGGLIADLRDPDNPRLSDSRWTTSAGVDGAHDVTEVAHGLVVTSSRPVITLLDVREDPEAPARLTTGQPQRDGRPDPNRFIHGNLWPNDATDRFLLVGGETGGNCSSEQSGAFMTFDASGVDLSPEAIAAGEVGEFRQVDEYRVFTGIPTDGDSPYNQFCAHWFTEHPDFADGGLVAMGWYEHGTRFLDVSDEGTITELGWFYPLAGSTSAAYWADEEIVYAVDYQRGIDILRFTGEPATGVSRTTATGPLPPVRTSALKNRPLQTDPYACPLPTQAPDPTGAMSTFPTAAAAPLPTATGGSSR
jgi:hypothetical protein